MSCRNRFLALLLALAVCSPAAAQGIVVPNTFVNTTTADADQVNANFAALVNNALNRAGGIMSGSLQTIDVLPVTTDVSDIGTNLKKYRDGWFSRNGAFGGTLTVGLGATFGNSVSVVNDVGMTGNVSVGGRADIGTLLSVGVGGIALRQIHVKGAGQVGTAPTDAGATLGTVYIQDTGSALGNGAILGLGAANTNPFAAIKAYLWDATNNGHGLMIFSLRKQTVDAFLTEVMRFNMSGGVGIGSATDAGAGGLAYSGAEVYQGVVTPPVIVADQADYNPANLANARVLRIEPSGAPRAVTGLVATSAVGHEIIIVNASTSQTLVLGHQTTSTANFRFICRGGANINLLPGERATAWYDSIHARWLVQ